MRIFQIHAQYREPGGEDNVVAAEHRALAQAGHEVHQHIARNPESTVAAATALAGSLWNPAAARRVVRDIAEFRPDVVHVHNTWFALSPSVLAAVRAHNIPIVMTLHNYRLACANALFLRDGSPCELCLEHGPASAVRYKCYRDNRALSAIAAAGIALHRAARTWSRLVDRFVVLSEFARLRLIQAGLPAHQLVQASNFAADLGPRREPPAASDEILFVGRLSSEKGVSVLLDAWRRLDAPGLRLVVIGDGPLSGELAAAAPADVTFTGRLSHHEVASRLRRARALVIPSVWYEGQPLTAVEGLSAGIPLVLSSIGGLPEVLGGSPAGWTTQPGNADVLACTLSNLLDGHDVDYRGQHARERYLNEFTPEAAVRRLEAVYGAAMGVLAI